MRSILLIFLAVFIFTGCKEPTLEEQKTQCLKENNKFTIKKVMNFRTGEIEHRGECNR